MKNHIKRRKREVADILDVDLQFEFLRVRNLSLFDMFDAYNDKLSRTLGKSKIPILGVRYRQQREFS